MKARHRIRLAGPWEAEVLHSNSHQELAGTHLKAALGATDEPLDNPFFGKLTLRRNFNIPSGLDEKSVVWLCLEGLGLPAQSEIIFNRRPLNRTDGGAAVARHLEVAVTDDLENFNRIEIVLMCCDAFNPIQILPNATSVIVQATVWLEIE